MPNELLDEVVVLGGALPDYDEFNDPHTEVILRRRGGAGGARPSDAFVGPPPVLAPPPTIIGTGLSLLEAAAAGLVALFFPQPMGPREEDEAPDLLPEVIVAAPPMQPPPTFTPAFDPIQPPNWWDLLDGFERPIPGGPGRYPDPDSVQQPGLRAPDAGGVPDDDELDEVVVTPPQYPRAPADPDAGYDPFESPLAPFGDPYRSPFGDPGAFPSPGPGDDPASYGEPFVLPLPRVDGPLPIDPFIDSYNLPDLGRPSPRPGDRPLPFTPLPTLPDPPGTPADPLDFPPPDVVVLPPPRPFDEPSDDLFDDPLPEFSPKNASGCDCTKVKEKKKKSTPRQPRTVCYEGTYVEYARGLTKYRKREVPCSAPPFKPRRRAAPGLPSVPGSGIIGDLGGNDLQDILLEIALGHRK